MFDLMTNVVHKSVSIWHFRISFCVLNWKLSVIRKWTSVVERSIHNLHLSIFSWNSSNNIKEDQATDLWIIFSRTSLSVWKLWNGSLWWETSSRWRSVRCVSLITAPVATLGDEFSWTSNFVWFLRKIKVVVIISILTSWRSWICLISQFCSQNLSFLIFKPFFMFESSFIFKFLSFKVSSNLF